MRERREHTRHTTSGHLRVTSVIGGGEPPSAQATLVNCSRSGALFRLPAPTRGFFKKRVGQGLSARDSITCVLHLAPAYEPVEMFGEVVRVEPARNDSSQLEVGLRFFHDVSRRTVMDPQHDALGRLLEPAKLRAEASEERRRKLEENTRRSQRQPKVEEPEELSCSEAARMVSKTSQRLRRGSQRLAVSEPEDLEELSCSEAARMVASTSQRLRARGSSQETQRLKKVDPQATQRVKKADPQATQRLKRVDPQAKKADPQATQRVKKVNEPAGDSRATRRLRKISGRHTVSSSSSRLSAKASQRLERVALDASARQRLEDSQLLESAVRTPTLAAWAQTRLHVASEPRLLDFGGQLGVRGRAVLRNGSAVIALPEAFAARAEAGTLTVHLTPRGPAALFLGRCTPARVEVQAVTNRGVAAVEFDYLVLADRGASLKA